VWVIDRRGTPKEERKPRRWVVLSFLPVGRTSGKSCVVVLASVFFVLWSLVRGKNLNFFGLWDSLSRSVGLVVVVQER